MNKYNKNLSIADLQLINTQTSDVWGGVDLDIIDLSKCPIYRVDSQSIYINCFLYVVIPNEDIPIYHSYLANGYILPISLSSDGTSETAISFVDSYSDGDTGIADSACFGTLHRPADYLDSLSVRTVDEEHLPSNAYEVSSYTINGYIILKQPQAN